MPDCTSLDIARMVEGRLTGPADIRVTGVASLQDATAGEVSFLGNDRYLNQVLSSRAGVVLVPERFRDLPPAGRAWVVCADPSAAFSKVIALFAPAPVAFPPGVHPTAVVHPTATVPASAHVGAQAVIEAGAIIGERTVIGALVYVGVDSRIGGDCLLYPHVSIRERCVLGNRVIVHCGVVIGSDGFGYIPSAAGHAKIPQLGIVQIDDDVEIGANTTVDRARFGKTWIKRGVKIDNLVQIAHNVVVGELSVIVAQVGIAGSTRLGRGVVAWGQAGLAGHLEIGDRSEILAQSGLGKDLPPNSRVMGAPAVTEKEFIRQLFNLHRMDKMATTVRTLQKELADLRTQLQAKTDPAA